MVDVFLSCSFRDDDAAVVEFVTALCSGLELRCSNVSAGSTLLPPAKAKQLISQAVGLVAIATRRDSMPDGSYRMPSSVHDEISIAFGLGKPVLLLVEFGVVLDGFMLSYGTHLRFDRAELYSPSVLESMVKSLVEFKIAYGPVLLRADQTYREGNEYRSELTTNLVSLEKDGDEPVWVSSVTKQLYFDAPFARELITGSWAGVPLKVDPASSNMSWEVSVVGGSKGFKANVTEVICNRTQVRLSCHFVPVPQRGDLLEFSRICRGKYLNVLYQHQLESRIPHITKDGQSFLAHTGFVPVEPTKRLRLQFRVPKWYGLAREDVTVFVASHSSSLDYLVASELERISWRVELFAGDIVVDIDADHPLPRHMYGVAWNPPGGAAV